MIIGPHTKRKDNILIDGDGVLLDTLRAYLYWFMNNVPEAFEKVLSNRNITEPFHSFMKSNNFSNIPAVKGSQDAIDFLKDKYNLTVITSVGDNKGTKEAREKNIHTLFGNNVFDDVYCLPFRASKKDSFESFNTSYPVTLIDDEIKNLNDAESLGFNVYRHKYYDIASLFGSNSSANSFKAYNWAQIIKLINDKHM